MADERVGLFLDVDPKGGDNARKAAAEVRNLHQELKQLREAWERGAVPAAQFHAEQDRLTSALARSTKAAEDATTRANFPAYYARSAAAAGNFNYQLFAMAQTLDDLQYVPEMGLRPIVNNLMMLSPVIGVAALATDQLVRHWSDLVDLWKGAKPPLEGLAGMAEAMGKATPGTLAQQKDAARYKSSIEGAAGVGLEPTPQERERAKFITEALADQNMEEIVKAAAKGSVSKRTPEEEKKLAAAELMQSRGETGVAGVFAGVAQMAGGLAYGYASADPNRRAMELRKEVEESEQARREDEVRLLAAQAKMGDPVAASELRQRLAAGGNKTAADALDFKRRQQEIAGDESREEQIRLQAIERDHDNRMRQMRREVLNRGISLDLESMHRRMAEKTDSQLGEWENKLAERIKEVRTAVLNGILGTEEGEDLARRLQNEREDVGKFMNDRQLAQKLGYSPEGAFAQQQFMAEEAAGNLQYAQERLLRAQINAMPNGFAKAVAQQQFGDMRREAMRAAQRQARWLARPENQKQAEHMRELAIATANLQAAAEEARKQPLRVTM